MYYPFIILEPWALSLGKIWNLAETLNSFPVTTPHLLPRRGGGGGVVGCMAAPQIVKPRVHRRETRKQFTSNRYFEYFSQSRRRQLADCACRNSASKAKLARACVLLFLKRSPVYWRECGEQSSEMPGKIFFIQVRKRVCNCSKR